jgi:hypothetical protein
VIAEKHLPAKTFRLALAPSIVNPRVNRLWLVPSEQVDGHVSDQVYSDIAAQFRDLLIERGHTLE